MCIKMLRNIMGALCYIQVTGTDMVFLFENMIIYDVSSALQFLLSFSRRLHSLFFSPSIFCIILQLSASTCIFAVSRNLSVTVSHLPSPTLEFAPQKHILEKAIFGFFHFAYSQQSSTKVTRKVLSKKECRGVSA